MRVHIYYGGRGLIEDSTLYVLSRITNVLEELRVEVKRYNLYECKNEIAVLAKRLEKKEITKEELTDEQKEKVIEYYREKNKELSREIEYKTKKFNELKREIINYYMKLKNT